MVMCFVPDCKHYSERKTCKFFVFPANEEEKKKWLELIRRADRDASKYSLVCSCQFVDGDRKNRPTLFEHNIKRKFRFVSPEKRKRNTKAKETTPRAISDLTVALEEATISSESDPIPGTSKDTDTSRSVSRLSSASSDATIFFLQEKVEKLSKQLDNLQSHFSFEHIRNNNQLVLLYTGIPSAELFITLFETMDTFDLKYYSGWNVEKIDKIDQLFLTLIKLRLNFPHQDLAVRFNCSTATITNVVITWLYALHEILFVQLMNIPTRRKNQFCLPSAFTDFFNCRIILDCTEVFTVVPKSMEKQRLSYSSYKHKNTCKGLVGVAPNGVITYVSKLYPGSLSDKKIVDHCGIMKEMKSGDLILADKGFLISDLLPEGVSLNIPPFLTTPQFTPRQVAETKKIAKARIHVERAIRRIKCYSILDKIPQYLIPHASTIFQTCAALTNLTNPLIKEVEEYYN